MIKLYYTYRIYKKFSNPVLGRRKLNQAGFFNLKITNRGVIDSYYCCKISSTTDEVNLNYEFVVNNSVNDEKGCSLLGSPFIFRNITNKNIKGRVERDCLNVSQNKTDGGCNVHSENAGIPAPTSEDTCYVLRVIKETGIEKSVDAQPTKDALESYCLSSKLTLKSDLFHLFTAFQL